jgi:hypothetical protein
LNKKGTVLYANTRRKNAKNCWNISCSAVRQDFSKVKAQKIAQIHPMVGQRYCQQFQLLWASRDAGNKRREYFNNVLSEMFQNLIIITCNNVLTVRNYITKNVKSTSS